MIQLRARSWFKTLHHPKGPSNSMSPSSDSRSWSSKLKSQVLRGHRPGGYCFEALLGNQFFLQFLLQALRLFYALFISVSSFALPRNLSTTIFPPPWQILWSRTFPMHSTIFPQQRALLQPEWSVPECSGAAPGTGSAAVPRFRCGRSQLPVPAVLCSEKPVHVLSGTYIQMTTLAKRRRDPCEQLALDFWFALRDVCEIVAGYRFLSTVWLCVLFFKGLEGWSREEFHADTGCWLKS